MCLIVLFSDHTSTSISPWRWYGQACLKFIDIFLLTEMKSSALNILCRLKHPSPNFKCFWHTCYHATWTTLTAFLYLPESHYHWPGDTIWFKICRQCCSLTLSLCTFCELSLSLQTCRVRIIDLKLIFYASLINIYTIQYWSRILIFKYSDWIVIKFKLYVYR